MKKIFLIVLTLISINVLADEPQKETQAEMSCNIYKTRIEAKQLKESTLLLEAKGQPFALGVYQLVKFPLPAPYQNITIKFEHYSNYYNETGPSTSNPFIIANFVINNTEEKGYSRSNFNLVNPEAGSKILLRNVLSIAPDTMLSYQCFLTIVK